MRTQTNELQAEEDQSFDAVDKDQPIPPSDIVAFNEQRSCADLFRMYVSGKLEIQPDFQRDVVWKHEEQSRFIDSLVKQLPIPSMCFSLDYKTQRWKVIDGLQRMSSIIKFLSEKTWPLANITDIHGSLKGRTNSDIKNGSEDDQRIYSAVEDVSIPITVIRCDYSKASHMSYLFTIFHRLNSGGVRLNNQEIRNCIYSGSFNDALKTFDSTDKEWGKVKKRIWGRMDRFKSVEVLLRLLALEENLHSYDGNLAKFLNDYMHSKKAMEVALVSSLQVKLATTMRLANRALLKLPSGKLPLTQIEALLVGIVRNFVTLEDVSDTNFEAMIKELNKTAAFSGGVRYGLASVENVTSRLDESIKVFATK